jgi:hypothetical protein
MKPDSYGPGVRKLNPNLFATQAQRTGPAAERECDLHEDIFAECERRGWLAFHGAMCRRTARTLGEPDWILLAPGGKLLMIECKSSTGKLSIEQQAIAAHAAKLGHIVHVVRSLDEFLNIIQELNL